jgi:hypothetical protein
MDKSINEIYIKGTPEAIEKIWNWIKDKSGLELGGKDKDYWVVDFKPQLKEEEE